MRASLTKGSFRPLGWGVGLGALSAMALAFLLAPAIPAQQAATPEDLAGGPILDRLEPAATKTATFALG